MLPKMQGQCLYAESFGGVVSGRNIGHSGFARQMHALFGNFTGNKGIDAERNRRLKIILCTTGTPCDPF